MSMKLIQGECLEVMKTLPDSSIDLTVTSPPYDNLRTYNGYVFDFEGIAKQLYRVTKEGGVVVWVVGDATINGSETGTSFKQALYFKEIGFNLHDTMIYEKKNFAPYDPKCNRYYQGFEFMFVFSKGKPKTCNYINEKCKNFGKGAGGYSRSASGELREDRKHKNKDLKIKEYKIKANIWGYSNNTRNGHPAPFPEKLAHDHIISWSSEGDTVLDPMMGSGTTGKVARILNRKFIGIEISTEYFDIATRRIEDTDPLFQAGEAMTVENMEKGRAMP